MEIRQLSYFKAVAEELHFRRAAEKLYIVQPAISRAITELEKELGVMLFDRHRRKVLLTPAGEQLLLVIGPILEKLEALPHQLQLIAEGMEGELRIGYVGSSVHTVFPKVLPLFSKKFPSIQTYLSELPSSHQLEMVRQGKLDIGFLRNPPPDPIFSSKRVWQEPFYLVLPVTHTLNTRNFKSLKQVQLERFILPPESDGQLYHLHMLGIIREAGYEPMVAHECTHGNTILQLVESGLGISILPATFKKLANKKVKFIPLKNTHRMAELTAVWLRSNKSSTLKKLVEMLT